MNSDQQVQALRDGRIQIGFLMLPVEDDQLEIEFVRGEPLMLAMAEKHPLAHAKIVPVRTLAMEPHILFSRSIYRGYYDQIVGWCRNAGFSLDIVHESDSI